MMVISIKMCVPAKKRKELLQTVQALMVRTRTEKGCKSCHFYQDVEEANLFSLVEAWQTQKDLDKHILSDVFGVLLGVMNLLSDLPEISFSQVGHTASVEKIKLARMENRPGLLRC